VKEIEKKKQLRRKGKESGAILYLPRKRRGKCVLEAGNAKINLTKNQRPDLKEASERQTVKHSIEREQRKLEKSAPVSELQIFLAPRRVGKLRKIKSKKRRTPIAVRSKGGEGGGREKTPLGRSFVAFQGRQKDASEEPWKQVSPVTGVAEEKRAVHLTEKKVELHPATGEKKQTMPTISEPADQRENRASCPSEAFA